MGRRGRRCEERRLRSDPELHVEAVLEFVDAGYDHVDLDQAGPNQEGFLRYAEAELLPRREAGRSR